MEPKNDEKVNVNENDKKMLGNKRNSIQDANSEDAKASGIPDAKDGVAAKQGFVPKKAKNITLIVNAENAAAVEAKIAKIIAYVKGSFKTLNYLLAITEEGDQTERLHGHIYMQFCCSVALRAACLEHSHYEVCKKSPIANVKYLLKNVPDRCSNKALCNDSGKVIAEIGNVRETGGTRISDAKKMTDAELDDLNLNLINAVNKIKADRANRIKNLDDLYKDIKVFYYYGASGAGKTVLAKEKAKECLKLLADAGVEDADVNMIKYEGSFWHGVADGSLVAIYDDFRDHHMPPSEFINLIDYNIHSMNVKGGSVKCNYKYVIITSIQDPYKIYAGAKNYDESKAS